MNDCAAIDLDQIRPAHGMGARQQENATADDASSHCAGAA
jgi:hypothetical protein